MNKCNRCGRFRNQNHICNPIKVLKSDGKTVDYYFTLGKSKLPKSSKKPTRNIKKKNRLLKGLTVGITSLVLTVWSLNALANFDMTTLNSVVYQKSTTTPTRITAVVQPSDEITPEQFRIYFLEEATKAGVWVEKAEHMMQVESGGWNPHARGDQKVLLNGNGMCKNKKSPLYGKPANARGGAQITQCWFPEITDEQADDYKFATKFMLDVILSGKDKCRMIYSTCDRWYELQK